MLNVSNTYLDLYNSHARRARFRFVPVEGAASSITQTITDTDGLEGGTLKRGFAPLDSLTLGIVYQGGLEVTFYRDRMVGAPWLIPPLEAGKCFRLEQSYQSANGQITSEWVPIYTGWVSNVVYLTARNVWQIKAVDSAYFLGQMFASDPAFEKIVYPLTFAKLWDYTNKCLQTVKDALGLWDFSLPEIPIAGNSEVKNVAGIAFRDIIANILVVAGCSMHSTGSGQLQTTNIKAVKTPYQITQKQVVFDAEITAYTKTLSRVGVANSTESWIYPPNERRFPGFLCVFSMYSSYANKFHAEAIWNNIGGYVHRQWKFRNSALPLHLEPGDYIEYVDEYDNTQNLLIGYMETALSGDPSTSCGLGDWKTSVEIKSSGEVAFTGAGAGSSISSNTAKVSRDGFDYDSEDGKKHARFSNNELRVFSTGNELSDLFASDSRGRLTGQNITFVNCAVAENTAGSVLNMAHVLSEYDRLRVIRYLQGDSSDFVAPVQSTQIEMGFARFSLGDGSEFPNTDPRQLIVPNLGPAYWLDGEPGRGIVCDPVLGSPLVGRPPSNGGSGTDVDPYQRVVGIDTVLFENFETDFVTKILPLHSGDYNFTLDFSDEQHTNLNITFSDDAGNVLFNGRPDEGLTELAGTWTCDTKDNWLKLSVRGITSNFSINFTHSGLGSRFYLAAPVPVMVYPYFTKSKMVMNHNGWELFALDYVPGKPYYHSFSGLKIETEPSFDGGSGFRVGRDGQYIHWTNDGIKIDDFSGGGGGTGEAGSTLILDHEPTEADVETLDATKEHVIVQYNPATRQNIAGTPFSKTSATTLWVLAAQVLLAEPVAELDVTTGVIAGDAYGDIGQIYTAEIKYVYTDPETLEVKELVFKAQQVVAGGSAYTITIPMIDFGATEVETQYIVRDAVGTPSKPRKFSISRGIRYTDVIQVATGDAVYANANELVFVRESVPVGLSDGYSQSINAAGSLGDVLQATISDGYTVTLN